MVAKKIQDQDENNINPGVINLRLKLLEDAVKSGNAVTDTILQKVNNMNFVPMQTFSDYKDQQDSKFEAFKTYVDTKYRKKEDGKSLRVFFIAVGTSVTIAVIILIVQFLGRGIFNVQT